VTIFFFFLCLAFLDFSLSMRCFSFLQGVMALLAIAGVNADKMRLTHQHHGSGHHHLTSFVETTPSSTSTGGAGVVTDPAAAAKGANRSTPQEIAEAKKRNADWWKRHGHKGIAINVENSINTGEGGDGGSGGRGGWFRSHWKWLLIILIILIILCCIPCCLSCITGRSLVGVEVNSSSSVNNE
jgi:hypothetical protein